jgi:hypothetical protein
MAVITKKIGNRQYAYHAIREGRKVVHKYLGPARDPRVMKIISEKTEVRKVPGRFRSLFWDTNPDNIHIKQNARYIIERILEFGSMDSLQWMQRVYPSQTIIDVLSLSRGLSGKSKNFWMIWFGVNDA